MRLPVRLEAVASLVTPGEVVADVGTGHGLLPAALVARGTPRVIATEVAAGPLAEARRLLGGTGRDHIALRTGWGLTPLQPEEAGVIVLAGMGGETIRSVLERGEAVARSAARLVLQPQNHPERVRRWLLTHGFALVAEDLVEEEGRFYPVVAAEPDVKAEGAVLPVEAGGTLESHLETFARGRGFPPVPAGLLLTVGPLLLAGRHPVLASYLDRRLAEAEALVSALERRAGARPAARRAAVRQETLLLEMMHRWLCPSARS